MFTFVGSTQLSGDENLKTMIDTKNDFVPTELLEKFDTLAEASVALAKWKKEHRGPGRPSQKSIGISVGTLRKMIKKS